MDSSQPGSSVHGDSLHQNSGVGSHSLLQGNLPDSGIEPGSPALQADALPSEPPGKHACSRVKVYLQDINQGKRATHSVRELKLRRTRFLRLPSGIYGHSGAWQRKSTKRVPAGSSEAEGKCKGATQEEKEKG